MKKKVLIMLIVLSVLKILSCNKYDQKIISLATTTSTENSGLLAAINPVFEKKTGIKVKVIALGTGASIKCA